MGRISNESIVILRDRNFSFLIIITIALMNGDEPSQLIQ